jgi:hypothetical protein
MSTSAMLGKLNERFGTEDTPTQVVQILSRMTTPRWEWSWGSKYKDGCIKESDTGAIVVEDEPRSFWDE